MENITNKTILKIQSAGQLKKYFGAGLFITGIENGQFFWMGTFTAWSNIK